MLCINGHYISMQMRFSGKQLNSIVSLTMLLLLILCFLLLLLLLLLLLFILGEQL
jgi:hypothetical protein